MNKKQLKLTATLLIVIIILPLLMPLSLPLVIAADDNGQNENKWEWIKGILLIFASIFLNRHFNPEENDKPSESEHIPSSVTIERENSKEVLGFHVNWITRYASSYQSLSTNIQTIDMVAPFWYTVDPDGSLKSRYGGHQFEVSQVTEKENTKLIPLINNNQQNNMILIDPEIRKKAVNNIVRLVEEQDYDGVNIDFEFLPPWTRDGYTAFIKLLASKLDKDRLLTISIFPKINVPISLQGAYDYSALSQYADRIVIMTYDHHWSTGPAGPVAPIKWVEENIEYALEYIPADKILMGIANYGYDWPANELGKDMGEKEALEKARSMGVEIKWNDETKSPYYTYTDNKGIKHEVWFENSHSLQFKMKLMKKYNLRGIAIWRLGNGTEDFWEVIAEYFY